MNSISKVLRDKVFKIASDPKCGLSKKTDFNGL